MKKAILLFVFSLAIICGFSQSDVSGPFIGHQRQAGRFCGWSPGLGSIAGPLDVRNDFNNHIAFFTAGANNTRMRIFGNGLSSSCPQGGGVGINPNPANPIVAPGSFLHMGFTTFLIHKT